MPSTIRVVSGGGIKAGLCENGSFSFRLAAYMLRPSWFIALFALFSLSACAQSVDAPASSSSLSTTRSGQQAQQPPSHPANASVPSATSERIRAALAAIDPRIKADYIGQSIFPGFSEVLVQGQLLFVTNDGHYLLQAHPIDLKTRQPYISQPQLAFRQALLKKIPPSDRIIFSPPSPKYTVTVFTDTECGYCRKLHLQIAEYNQRGIAVEYVAFPRAGLNTSNSEQMDAVWCAKDRKKALTDAKMGSTLEKPKGCVSPVAMEYTLGVQLGVNGTPAIYSADGEQIGGYLDPDQMLAVLSHQQSSP